MILRNPAWTVATGLLTRVGGPADVLIDPALADHPAVAAVRRWLAGNGVHGRVQPCPQAPGPAGIVAAARTVADAALVIAIGGGSVLDVAKLVTLAADERFAAALHVPQRGGIVVVPAGVARAVPLIAVPTTLGTGSEASPVAVLDVADARRLVIGRALRPEASIHDPGATEGLPAYLAAEGVAEILFRIAGPYVGDDTDQPTPDGLAEAALRRIVELGEQRADLVAAGTAPSGQWRAEVATISAFTHSEWVVRVGKPFAVKGWLLATELATTAGVRKMTAIAAMWPHLWHAIDRGEARLGDRLRLRRLWALARDSARPGLPADPADGIAALLSRWRIEARIAVEPWRIDETARRTVRAWGAGLPMLGGLDVQDVRALLARSVAPAEGQPRRTA